MAPLLNSPLVARDGQQLKVIAICRISTKNQDERSLEDQEALYRGWLDERTDLSYQMTVLAGQGSGELLERAEYLRAIELVESGQFDLVISEDLARICRRVHAILFCEICEDTRTRLIGINDHVDTGQDGWRLHSFFAVMHHETHNQDTSNRIRRSLRNRFRQGGVFQFPTFGYIKPQGAESDADVFKDPEAEPIFRDWFHRLDMGATYAEIADWLNERTIPTGPYCRQRKWDGRMVARITHNQILKGTRVRNDRVSRRINKTGQRRSEKAPPAERLERHCPHLAFVDPDYYDRVIADVDERNAKYRRQGNGEGDPRRNVPKKRTRFPGQLVYCGLCGWLYVFGGHGQTDHLMCAGARGHQCWNGVTVDGPLAAKKISSAIFAEIAKLPDFAAVFRELINEESKRLDTGRDQRQRDLRTAIDRREREIDNCLEFIRKGETRSETMSERVRKDLVRLEREQSRDRYELEQIQRTPANAMTIPSIEEIQQLANRSFEGLPLDSFEFARLMGRLIPKIVVFPCRLCDGGRIGLRAKFRLLLANVLPDRRQQEVLNKPLERVITVDLFEPPQREAFRERVVQLRAEGKTERQVAELLGLTKTAAQRAAALQRRMDELELTDPYLPVTDPPDDCTKLRRHLHPRYRFEPLDDVGEF